MTQPKGSFIKRNVSHAVEFLLQVADSLRLEPGERRQRMHVLNFCFHMVPVPQSITVTVEVTTPLLYIDEYPADASRGFDVPATSVHVPQASTLATKHPQAQCMQHLQDAYMNLDAVPQRKVSCVPRIRL